MSALDTSTLVVLAMLALVTSAAMLVSLGILFTVLTGVRIRPVAAVRSVAGFLERASRDITTGFLNGLEWLVYGARYAA